MNRRNSHQAWQLENLETRQLLSAGVPAIEPLLGVGHAVVAEPMVKTPNIVGTWNAASIEKHSHETSSATVTITSQSRRGVLVGTGIATGGSKTTMKITGSISGNSVTLKADNSTGTVTTITGTLSKNGKTISGTYVNSGGNQGTITITRA